MPELIVRKWDGPYSFMVFREEGLYKARRGDNGSIQFEDPELHEVLNDVWNALTPNRTQKERVVLKGSFELTDTIKVPSYTILVVDGKLKLADGVNKPLLQEVNPTGGVTEIEIHGGEYDGNKANQTIDVDAISFTKVMKGIFLNMHVHNAKLDGLVLDSGCEENKLINLRSENCGQDGFVDRGKENYWVNPTAKGNGGDGFVIKSQKSCFLNPKAINNTFSGFAITNEGDLHVFGNQLLNAEAYGNGETGCIVDVVTGTTQPVEANRVEGYFHDNTLEGLRLEGTNINRYNLYNVILSNNVAGNFYADASVVRRFREVPIVLVKAAGANITGNAGTSYAGMIGGRVRWTPANWTYSQIEKVEWFTRWNPETASGGIQLLNETDVIEIDSVVPGAAGWVWTSRDVTSNLKALTTTKTLNFGTKGDGTTAPIIRFSLLRVVLREDIIIEF